MERKPIRILLVDDDVTMLWGLGKLIEGEYPRMSVVGAVRDADEALVYCDLHPDVTLLDINLRGGSSMGFIPSIRERSGGQVVVLTGLRDHRLRESALSLGATEVIRKHESGEAVLRAIEAAGRGVGQ